MTIIITKTHISYHIMYVRTEAPLLSIFEI